MALIWIVQAKAPHRAMTTTSNLSLDDIKETVKSFSSYEEAAKAASGWVERGKGKVDRSLLRPYRR